MRVTFLLLATLFIVQNLHAQQNEKLSFDGNIRYSLTTIGNDHGYENGISAIRTRLGAKYSISSTQSFRVRAVTTFSEEFEKAKFTLKADGSGLDLGSISFDEFYYRFNNTNFDIKIGRFQHTIAVLSNAKRSLMRFQGANVSTHWSDGVYAKKNLKNGWYTEFIGEYQLRNRTSYPYQGPLNFGNNEHNITSYLAIENRTRDSKNIIQKGIGLFFAPNAYYKGRDYVSYFALTSRIALDFPQPNLLRNGSFRIAGELGQNISGQNLSAGFYDLKDGTIAIVSIGINNFADQHEFMVEFATTDREWLLANAYARGGKEVEFRYRYFINKDLSFDTRYRVRHFSGTGTPNVHGAFFRLTYSF